jgi:hypothetical protein
MADPDDFVKVHVDLSGNQDSGGEAMWSKQLGEDLYELRNVPFRAYHLNWGDIVRAVEHDPSMKPSVQDIVQRSGHRTLWLQFVESVPPAKRVELLSQLNEWEAYFEGMDGRYFAIDIEPPGDYDSVVARIEEWRTGGLLEYYRLGSADSDVRYSSQ